MPFGVSPGYPDKNPELQGLSTKRPGDLPPWRAPAYLAFSTDVLSATFLKDELVVTYFFSPDVSSRYLDQTIMCTTNSLLPTGS
jgi:hypothetical protein